MTNIAVIPARGGSKRISRKNIKSFAGRPIIAYSIDVAKRSGLFDRVIVSTDDKEIAEIAIEKGAEVPFLRPESLADDFTPTIPVMRHCINQVLSSPISTDYVCCVYATAPFLGPPDLLQSFEVLTSQECAYVFSGCRFDYSIHRAMERDDKGYVTMLHPEHFAARSQDFSEAYHDAGQFYWGSAPTWLKNDVFFTNRSVLFELPTYRVQDIDTEGDWIRAELVYQAMKIRNLSGSV